MKETNNDKNCRVTSATNRKKPLMIITSAVIIVVIALIIGISNYNSLDNRLKRQLDLGQKYLEEMNYEQAVVEFDKAIEIDSMSVEAYLGKAEAYIGMNDIDTALLTLQEGYALNGDERLKNRISEIENTIDGNQLIEGTEIDVKEILDEQKEADKVVQYDFELSDFGIAGYDMFDNHFEEVCSSLGVPIKDLYEYGVDNEYGYMSASYDEQNRFRFYHNHEPDYGLQYEGGDSIKTYSLWVFYYDGDYPPGIVTLPEFVKMPFELGNTYDEWCKFIKYSEIRNKGIEQLGDGSKSYTFATKWGEGYYIISNVDDEIRCIWISNYEYYIYAEFNDEERANYLQIEFIDQSVISQ